MKHGNGESHIKTIWNSMFNRVGGEEKRIGKVVLLFIFEITPSSTLFNCRRLHKQHAIRKNMNDQFGAKYRK